MKKNWLKSFVKRYDEELIGVGWGLLAIAVVGWVIFAALWAVKPL